jgi:hypothetical protein
VPHSLDGRRGTAAWNRQTLRPASWRRSSWNTRSRCTNFGTARHGLPCGLRTPLGRPGSFRSCPQVPSSSVIRSAARPTQAIGHSHQTPARH